MRIPKVLLRGLGVEGAMVEDVVGEEAADGRACLVISVRPKAKEAGRCPDCGRRCPGYDAGGGRRRWRALDCGSVETYLEANAPRVQCREHGVVVARVPWARHGTGFTYAFEDTVAWLATRTDKTTLATLMSVAWRTVCAIIERVVASAQASIDPLEGLVRIGIDEVSYRKGHRYITVVVDHDTGRLLWASVGRDEATLEKFFEKLGAARASNIIFVSADAATWIANVVARQCPRAILCLDPFHIVQWATRALDQVRRDVWNDLRTRGESTLARSLKHSRWALWKNPDDLTAHQRERLALIERENRPLYRAYLLKEQQREIVRLKGRRAMDLLDHWLAWASRSRLEPFVQLARSVRNHRQGIDAALAFELSNARTESTNTKIRLLHRMAFGFHSAQPLISLALLKLGGLCPMLPGRIQPTNVS
jgi:transposase